MEKSDKTVFWIIETIIIILVLAATFYILKEYQSLPENFTPPLHNGKIIWILRLYPVLPEFCLGGIFLGTIMNISALFTARLKFFSKLSWINKIFTRLFVAVLTLIISEVIFTIVWILLLFAYGKE